MKAGAARRARSREAAPDQKPAPATAAWQTTAAWPAQSLGGAPSPELKEALSGFETVEGKSAAKAARFFCRQRCAGGCRIDRLSWQVR